MNQIPKTRLLSFSFKPSKFLIGAILFLFLAYALRLEILNAIGDFLILETELPKSFDAVFVLSGNSFDRANKTFELSGSHHFNQIVCSGGNQIQDMKSCCPSTFECDFTAIQLHKLGIKDSIIILKEGTSTKEESIAIQKYCLKNNLDTILIVSNLFHTRRISKVFISSFNEKRIHVFISGAPDSRYAEKKWWKSEEGLIALNNEYIKLGYYLVQ